MRLWETLHTASRPRCASGFTRMAPGPGRKRRAAGRLALSGLTLVITVMLAACASNPTPGEAYDPFEGANRKVYAFNEEFDTYVLSPAARGWTAITPAVVRRGVGNFFDNLAYPGTIINDALQGKGTAMTQDTVRFLINSTLGFAGFYDAASKMGLPAHDEDLGQTFGVWGASSGAFLMLPVLGPSNVRDLPSWPAAWYTNVLTYTSITTATTGGLTALNLVNKRAQLEKAVRIRQEAALDPYAFTRSSYEQLRLNKIYDGNPPRSEDPYADFFNKRQGGSK